MKIREMTVTVLIVMCLVVASSARAGDPAGGACCVCGICVGPTVCFEGVLNQPACQAFCETAGCEGSEDITATACELVTSCADIRIPPLARISPVVGATGAFLAALAAGLAGTVRLLQRRRTRSRHAA